MKKFISIFLVLLLLLCVGCGKSQSDVSPEDYNSGSPNEISSDLYTTSNRKIYYTISYSLDVSNVDEAISILNTKVQALGGYIENSSESLNNNGDYSYARYIYRVPTDKINEFMNYVDGNTSVTSKQVDSIDITTQYVSTEARIETLQASRVAYLKMLENETLSVSEIISINTKVEDIDTEIAELTKSKNQYDSLIDYSVITITFAGSVEEEGFFSEYATYLLGFVEVIFYIIMYTLPVAVLAFVVLAIIFISKKRKKNKINKKEKSS